MLYGLRPRLVGALLLGSAVTLAVAAALLLSPLESRLLSDEAENLVRAVRGNRTTLSALASDEVRAGSPVLVRAARNLRRRTGGEISILTVRGVLLAATDPDEPLGGIDPRTLDTHKTIRTVTGSGADATARVVLPVTVENIHLVVVARRRLNDARDAVLVVRGAFLSAAAISLGIALLLGLVLAGRLVRRLRALRDTALRVAELGPVVEMRADTTRDEVGDLTRALTTMQDRLREQEQARRAFVATASHELRTPLSSLRLMLDLLHDDLDREVPDVGDARVQVARAEAQAERLGQLAADLLDLSRLDSGTPARSELVDVGEVTRSVIAEFEVRAQESGHDLVLACPAIVWAVGDPGAVAQIVRILVDNALSHGPPASAVRIGVGLEPHGPVTLTVTDYGGGDGIPIDGRERIFQRFERGDAAAGAPGFGLGLAIGRELARRMGGDVQVDEPGASGTTFRVTMPAAPAS